MSLRCLIPALTAFVFTLSASAQTPDSTPKPDPRIPQIIHSLEQVKSIRETQLSPDGQLIAWDVNDNDIELASLSNPAQTRRITACAEGAKGHESSLAWSPDSKTLAFFSTCTASHKTAVFTADATTSAAPHLLAQLNGYAKSLQYSPDGKFLSFLYVDGATRPSGALAAMKPPSGVIGVEGLEVQRVAVVDALSGRLQQITPANLHVYEFDWSNDSSKLAYIAAPPPGEDNWWTAKLYTQAANAAEPKAVFDPNITSGPLHGLQIAVPRWSPDGSKIAFIGGLMSDQGSTGGDIYTIPSIGGEATDVTPDRPATPAWFEWLDEQQLGYRGSQQRRVAPLRLQHRHSANLRRVQPHPPRLHRRGRARDARLRLQLQQHRLHPLLIRATTRVWAGPLERPQADHPLQRRAQALMGQN